MEPPQMEKTFWEHLDDLRDVLIRVLVAVGVAMGVCLCFGQEMFDIVLRPASPDFVLFRLLSRVKELLFHQSLVLDRVPFSLINTELSGQLMMHIKMSLCAGIMLAMPFVLWQVAAYVSPALYPAERRAMRWILVGGTFLFLSGLAVSYLLIFPLAFRFLASYSLDGSIQNMISISSYIDNFFIMHTLMGVMFELPLVAIALAKAGFIDARAMRHYRRHAILGILVVAAVITPTTDVFTLLMVGLPIYVLYEVSILVVSK